jgi:O-antigen/teichoic acid export membrane protein
MQNATVSSEIMADTPLRASPYSRDNVRKGVLHYLLGRGMSGVASFVSVILLVRYMDVESYAGYTALLGLTMMATILSGLGLGRALARYIPEGRMHHSARALRYFVWITSLLRFLAAAAFTAGIFALWPLVIGIFDGVRLKSFPLPLAFFLIATGLFQHFSSVLQSLMLQKTLTRTLIIQWGGRLGIILAFITSHSAITLEQSLWVMAVPEMVGVFVFMMIIHVHLRSLIRQQVPTTQGNPSLWPCWREVVLMAMHNYGYNLLAAPPQGYFMRMLAAALLPAPFVAAYGFFLSLVERARLYLPLQLLYNIAEPALIASYVKDKDLKKLFVRTQLLYKFNLFVLAPVLTWLFVEAPDVIHVLTEGKYSDHSWLIFLIIAQVVMDSHANSAQLILNAVTQSQILVRSGLIACLCMYGYLSSIFAHGQLIYLVFAPLIHAVVNNTAVLFQLNYRGYRYHPPWLYLAKTTAAAAIAYVGTAVIAGLIDSRMGRLLGSGSTTLGLFLLGFGLFAAIRQQEWQVLRGLMKKTPAPSGGKLPADS